MKKNFKVQKNTRQGIRNSDLPSTRRKGAADNKRKPVNKSTPQPKRSKIESDEEISSDEDVNIGEHGETLPVPKQYSSEEEETAQDMRVRKSKQYLEELRKNAEVHGEDVDGLLRTEVLSSIDKLRIFVAGKIQGHASETVLLKHKKQNATTCSFALTADGKFMFVGAKCQTVLKWNVETNELAGSFEVQPIAEPGKKQRSQVIAMCISSDGNFLALSVGSKSIQIWCPKQFKHLKTFFAHRDIVVGLTIPKDSHDLYSASQDRSVCVWSLDEMALVETLHGHEAGITSIDSLNRDRVITSGGYDCSVRIFKITESLQAIYYGHEDGIDVVKFISKTNFVSGGLDSALCLWDIAKKKALHTIPLAHGKHKNGVGNWISAITALPNSDLVATGSCDGFIRLWRVVDGRRLSQILEIPVTGHINQLALNSDGSKLFAAIGKEQRRARFDVIREAKNGIRVFTLLTKAS